MESCFALSEADIQMKALFRSVELENDTGEVRLFDVLNMRVDELEFFEYSVDLFPVKGH
jgi:hypothetical protein